MNDEPAILVVCCWCERELRSDVIYDCCPHCNGSFSFGKPVVVDVGAFI
ncbi:MAG TPA: hypothetical protein VD932_02430 [Aquabacterium sp.]|nr:hypothetical protein [Aquabacterium sp.]